LVKYTSGAGVYISAPRGVGVRYCPHSDMFPMQDDRKKERVSRTIAVFFMQTSAGIIPVTPLKKRLTAQTPRV
jgi:hypothetical protein